MRVIDLRSDTVTRPSAEMRRAMAEAAVGDDVFGDDPTVNALQAYAAGLFGKEAGLFFPSGTMSNQAALLAHTQPRRRDLPPRAVAHPALRAGRRGRARGAADALLRLRGRHARPRAMEEFVHADDDPHFAPTRAGRTREHAQPLRRARPDPGWRCSRCAQFCDRHGLRLHLDGARVCNAAVASGLPPAAIAAPFDSVSVCLSKGLGAPVGSVLVGSRRVHPARRPRAQAPGRRHAAGGHHRRRRPLRPAAQRRPPRRGPPPLPECSPSGSPRARRSRWTSPRSRPTSCSPTRAHAACAPSRS